MMRRGFWFWLAVSIAVTVGGTLLIWGLTGRITGFFGFLFLPLLPFVFGRRQRGDAPAPTVQRCPVCGFTSADPDVRYCPRDGQRLA